MRHSSEGRGWLQSAVISATLGFALGSVASGCSPAADTTSAGTAATRTDAEQTAEVTRAMHDALLVQIDALLAACQDLAQAAPVPVGRGWDATADAASIDQMKQAFYRARSAYERIEGAVAPLAVDLDTAIDARYDDFLAVLGAAGDPDPFDGEGVTGMHAIERILWANETPARVVRFEASLPGSSPARSPNTEAEANEFKTGLAGALVTDVTTLRTRFQPLDLQIGIAFQGLVALMNEQREKVNKAASDEEESRYSGRTMADLRDNLAGTRAVYALFEPWLRTKTEVTDGAGDAGSESGPALDADILAGFAVLDGLYSRTSGDAIPEPPATWNAERPTETDLSTPFGVLYAGVLAEVDPNDRESIVSRMDQAGLLLGFPVALP